ncbi:TRAP transporter small permease [Dethiosulfatibacter aminovorans]|uniref:TRAP transporter small permease n=1 Tax=Dethiosulfatibacter aminovorans TaxID=332095 RepID=UPI001587B195|nr:TRAP transporter small permease subunit [Dethiosulfatibacter aminovorans]
MKLLNLIDKAICRIEKVLLTYGIILMSVILIANVLSRLIFKNSIVFAEEVGRYLIIIVTFIGMSHVARIDKHVKVAAFYDSRKTKKSRKILAVMISSVTSATLFWLAYITFRYMMTAVLSGRVSPALGIPVYIVIGVVTLGILFTAIQYLVILIKNLTSDEVYIGRFPESEAIEEVK